MKASDQADKALEFLDYCFEVEQGGYGDKDGRELTETEKEVKDTALQGLNLYFAQMPDFCDSEPKPDKPKVTITKKRVPKKKDE